MDLPALRRPSTAWFSCVLSLGEIAAPVGLVGQKLGPAEREVVEGDVEQPMFRRSNHR